MVVNLGVGLEGTAGGCGLLLLPLYSRRVSHFNREMRRVQAHVKWMSWDILKVAQRTSFHATVAPLGRDV